MKRHTLKERGSQQSEARSSSRSLWPFSAPQDMPKLNRFCQWRKGPFLTHKLWQGVYVWSAERLYENPGISLLSSRSFPR